MIAGPAPILALDASTYRATVAVVRAGQVVADAVVAMRDRHDERLLPAVAAILEQAGVRPGQLGGVVCGDGPGSFTSLRIAAALAKGIAEGAAVPLAAVSSLVLIAAGDAALPAGRYLVSLDALRGDRYAMLVDVASSGPGAVRSMGEARLLPVEALAAEALAAGAMAIGPGCAIDAWPEARGIVRAAEAIRAVDVATWEPNYGRRAEADVRRDARVAASG